MYTFSKDGVKMSKVEAAYLILKKNKKPMTYREIIEIALKENLIQTKGMTPEQTLRVDILHENRRREKQGVSLRFDISNKGVVSLLK